MRIQARWSAHERQFNLRQELDYDQTFKQLINPEFIYRNNTKVAH